MNDNNLNIQEDAKSDWMKIVNKHKKKQKGLPALSKLNTNAGNVEYNISVFNSTSSEPVLTSPISGPFGESGGCCESVGKSFTEESSVNNEEIILEYHNLPINISVDNGYSGGYYSSSFGNFLPDDYDDKEVMVDWSYAVDKNSVIEILQDIDEVERDLFTDDITSEEYQKKIEHNIDELVKKYNSVLLDWFREDAISDAEENYDYEELEPEYSPYDESVSKDLISENLDDKFDMSMRTLL